MMPERMHAIETVEKYGDDEGPPLIRVEIKIPQP